MPSSRDGNVQPTLETIVETDKRQDENNTYDIYGYKCDGNNCTSKGDPGSFATEMARAENILLFIVFMLAVVGNSVVIAAIMSRKKKIGRMFLFILHLSFADIMVAFFNILSHLLIKTIGPYGVLTIPELCKFVSYMQMVPTYASSYILVMTAIDRYIAICHPLRNYTWTKRRCHIMAGLAWVIAFLLGIPQLIVFKFQYGLPLAPHNFCRDQFDLWPQWLLPFYTLGTAIFLFILPLIIISFMYGFISCAVWKNAYLKRSSGTNKNSATGDTISIPAGNTSQKTSVTSSDSNKTNDLAPRTHSRRSFSRAKLKTVLLTLVVIIAFVVCWTPYYVCMIWWAFDSSAATSTDSVVVIAFLSNLNSCCNPWIYMVFSGSLFTKLFPKCCRPESNDNHSQGRTSMYSKCDTEFSTISTVKKNRIIRQNNYELTNINTAFKRVSADSETCSLISADCFSKKKVPPAIQDGDLSLIVDKSGLRKLKSASDSNVSTIDRDNVSTAFGSAQQIPTIVINGKCTGETSLSQNNIPTSTTLKI